MICKSIKIFSQNIHKNNLLTNTILEAQRDFDITLIQELLWAFIQSILSSMSNGEEHLVEVPNHPNWTTFSRNTLNDYNSLRVVSCINFRLLQLCFSWRNDIFNYRDILCFLLQLQFHLFFGEHLLRFVTNSFEVSKEY